MGRRRKQIILSILLLISALIMANLISTQAISANSTSKPSVPDFTVQYVSHPYDVQPGYEIDEYGEKIAHPGYHVENRSLEIKVKNEPFASENSNYSSYSFFGYNIRYKGHYEKEWKYPFGSLDGCSLLDGFPKLSSTEYTIITPQIYFSYKQPVDFQVQSLAGNLHYFNGRVIGFVDILSFEGETSAWSETKTVFVERTPISEDESSQMTEQVIDMALFGENLILIVLALAIIILAIMLLMLRKKVVSKKNF